MKKKPIFKKKEPDTKKLIYMPNKLYEAIKEAAKKEGVSANRFIVVLLGSYLCVEMENK